MVLFLLPGVLGTLDGAGSAEPSVEVKGLIDYNGALTEENQSLRDGMSKAVCSPDGTYDVPPAGHSDIDDRLHREGAQAGAIEVSLAWDGAADLDLSVTCPTGTTIGDTIMFNHPRACGGQHDVDMNDGHHNSTTPVEHITWPEGAAPPGEYKVNVNYFKQYDNSPASLPYTVVVKINGQERRVQKNAQCCGNLDYVTSFVVGAPGEGGGGSGNGQGGAPGTEQPPAQG